jgi:hypothetical protein
MFQEVSDVLGAEPERAIWGRADGITTASIACVSRLCPTGVTLHARPKSASRCTPVSFHEHLVWLTALNAPVAADSSDRG